VERRGLRDDPEALVGDADLAGDPAAAVGADQVVAANRVGLAGLVVPDHGRHAVVVLRQLEQLVVEADPPRRKPLRACPQDRFEPDLRQVELMPWAGRSPELVLPAGAPALELRDPPAGIGVRA
jgi:hypothetical protein